MTRTIIYRYLGTNGVLETPIHLEDVYYVRLVKLQAGPGKMLTDGTKVQKIVTVPEENENDWYEIEDETI